MAFSIEQLRGALGNRMETCALLRTAAAEGMSYDKLGKMDFRVEPDPEDIRDAEKIYKEVPKTPENENGAEFYTVDRLLVDEKNKLTGPYYMFHRGRDGKETLTKVRFDDVLDFVSVADAKKPQEPKRSAWETIKGWFGRSEEKKKYEREMEVYRAQKMDRLKKNFGFSGLKYNEALVDGDAAKEYIKSGKLPAKEERKAEVDDLDALLSDRITLSDYESISSEDLKKRASLEMLEDVRKSFPENSSEYQGAKLLVDLVNEPGKSPERDFVIDTLSNIRGYIKGHPNDTKTAGKLQAQVQTLCKDMEQKTRGTNAPQNKAVHNLVQKGQKKEMPQTSISRHETRSMSENSIRSGM